MLPQTPQNENDQKENQITSESLWGLLFPACSCHVDTERGHFIRRTAGNNLAHAIVATNETADWVKAHCAGEHIHIQRIDEDGLSYSVIWDSTEWNLSDERRRTLRANHLASDISFLHKKAEELRIEMIADALSKAKLFTKQKAFEVAAAITSQGEEVYLNKSRQLNDALRGAFNNINCYFPIEEVLKIVDTRGLLEKLNPINQPQQDEQKPTEEMSEGSSTPQSQDGQGYYQECNLTPTAGG
jgi:hypothetical protein